MSKARLPEEELLVQIRKGDREAFEQIYDIYSGKIYRFIYFKVSSREIAQDLTSDCFLKTFEHFIERSAELVNIRAFLYRVARNLVIDHYRGKDKEPLKLNEAIDYIVEDLHEKIELQVDREKDLQQVATSLLNLKAEWQELILLRYVEDYSIAEVAEIINKKPGTVRVALHRALQTLKREIAKIK
jgi:RNA polymerase sigma-70 factor, ECF subfamily